MRFSPQVNLFQVISVLTLSVFFCWHAWKYDRFRGMYAIFCRSTSSTASNFKTLMLWCYSLGMPAFVVQSLTFSYIKYEVGGAEWQEWPAKYQRLILPMISLLALAWSCEFIGHWEELAFFLRLISVKPNSRSWFQSLWFKSVLGMIPAALAFNFSIVAIWHKDPVKAHAVLYLSASLFVLGSNVAFIPVVLGVPRIIKQLHSFGGPTPVQMRLAIFHELNKIRIASRCLFGGTFFITSVDHLADGRIRHTPMAEDFLMLVGITSFLIQAILSIVIFLPRDMTDELKATLATHSTFGTESMAPSFSRGKLSIVGNPLSPKVGGDDEDDEAEIGMPRREGALHVDFSREVSVVVEAGEEYNEKPPHRRPSLAQMVSSPAKLGLSPYSTEDGAKVAPQVIKAPVAEAPADREGQQPTDIRRRKARLSQTFARDVLEYRSPLVVRE